MSSEVHLVYVTVSSEDEGLRLAHAAVEEGLAACANLLPEMTSVYRWEGRINRASEHVLLLKTTTANLDLLITRVVQLHSYECPCVVSWPLENGHPDFLKWVNTQAQSQAT